MTVIQEKPIKDVVAREPQSYPLASKVTNVAEPVRIKYLRVALQLVGLIFIFGIYTLSIVWPSGWIWHTGHTSHYLQMILGVYATLGVFLLIASHKPLSTLEPYLVHSVVQRCTLRDHGRPGLGEPGSNWTPFGRRPGTPYCRRRPRVADAAKHGNNRH